MMTDLKTHLYKYIPEHSVDYCHQLWLEHNFRFVIKKKRKTKLGDYRYDPKLKRHSISVNNDLNPYSFLITYLHEVAHLIAFKKYGRKAAPHGQEWKNAFKMIMLPVLNDKVFPEDVLRKAASYLKNPKASSCNDHALTKVLSKYDKKQDGVILEELPLGQSFTLGSRKFKKDVLRRTRFLCEEIESGKKYLVSKSALVQIIE